MTSSAETVIGFMDEKISRIVPSMAPDSLKQGMIMLQLFNLASII